MTDPVLTVPKIKMRAYLSQDMGLDMAATQLWVGIGGPGSMHMYLRDTQSESFLVDNPLLGAAHWFRAHGVDVRHVPHTFYNTYYVMAHHVFFFPSCHQMHHEEGHTHPVLL